jgi:endonuclease III
MTKKERYRGILEWFAENMPVAETELRYDTPFHLLISVILSAQCTDRRVNMVTPDLFLAYPDAESLADASFDDVFPYVKSISYPNSKTRHIIGMAQKVVSEFGGEIPSDIDSLMTLPGVGRKTANVVASIVYDKPVIAVDTHVFRVARRLGLSDAKTPESVGKELESNIPEDKRAIAHHWLILQGRYVCTARKPQCGECGLVQWCRFRQDGDGGAVK